MKVKRVARVMTVVITIAKKAKKNVDAATNGLVSVIRIVLRILVVAVQALLVANFMRFLIPRNTTE